MLVIRKQRFRARLIHKLNDKYEWYNARVVGKKLLLFLVLEGLTLPIPSTSIDIKQKDLQEMQLQN